MSKYSWENFKGKFVEVVVDVNITATNDTEQGTFQKTHPMLVSGYFLDMDSSFVYIGSSKEKLSDMIAVKNIVHVGESTPFDQYEKLLDDAEVPSDENGFS